MNEATIPAQADTGTEVLEETFTSSSRYISLALVGEQDLGNKIRKAHLVAMDAYGMIFPDGMTLERWKDCGRAILQIERQAKMCQADWMKYGLNRFGAEEVEKAQLQMELPMEDMDLALRVMKVPREARALHLEAEHLAAVAELPQEKQREWLDLAVLHQLTPYELEKSIELGGLAKSPVRQAENTGLLNIHGIMGQFERWRKRVLTRVPIVQLSPRELDILEEQLHPAEELLQQIRAAKAHNRIK